MRDVRPPLGWQRVNSQWFGTRAEHGSPVRWPDAERLAGNHDEREGELLCPRARHHGIYHGKIGEIVSHRVMQDVDLDDLEARPL